MNDLVCLVADKNMEAAVAALLERREALRIREIQAEIQVHPRRDPGCFHEAPEFLDPLRTSYAHALILLDCAWEGAPHAAANDLEADLRRRLGEDGWAEVVAIEPELEIWVWSDSTHVDRCLGWEGQEPRLRAWLSERALWPSGSAKPNDPKGAVESALRKVRLPRSSAIYRNLASSVSVDRCTDASFNRFCERLRAWFPA